MSNETAEVVRQLRDAFKAHDLDALDALVADDVAWHGGSFGEITGLEGFKQLVGSFTAAFPDLALELYEVIADRDLVAARWTTTGTQEGEVLGVPATGKRATWTEQPIYRIVDGKVREVWWLGDARGLMQQLGAIPTG